jgi:hypothetical protein
MMDIGAVEQRADRRNQYDIVGPNQFPHLRLSYVGPTTAQGASNCFMPLPRSPVLSIVIA